MAITSTDPSPEKVLGTGHLAAGSTEASKLNSWLSFRLPTVYCSNQCDTLDPLALLVARAFFLFFTAMVELSKVWGQLKGGDNLDKG